jgi:hypothetical protein
VKNQYFGDRRDLIKYDLLVDLAGCLPGSRLVLIPMLTPNDGSGEGRLTSYRRGERRERLVDALRDAVAAGTRNIQILRNLMPTFGVQYMPHRDGDYFQDATRAEYFAAVPTQWLAGSLVFFDPDIGLQTGTVAYMRGSGAEKYLLTLTSVPCRQEPQTTLSSSCISTYRMTPRSEQRTCSDGCATWRRILHGRRYGRFSGGTSLFSWRHVRARLRRASDAH